jgi:hypothetical protein
MYTLLTMISPRRIVFEQLPPLALAWMCAEIFFKFHSFTLECAAFLLTWFVIDALIQSLLKTKNKESS